MRFWTKPMAMPNWLYHFMDTTGEEPTYWHDEFAETEVLARIPNRPYRDINFMPFTELLSILHRSGSFFPAESILPDERPVMAMGLEKPVMAGNNPTVNSPVELSAPFRTNESLQKVNINRASEFEIGRLPGLGPILAKKVIAQRERQGGFHSMEEFAAFLHLRPHCVENLKDLIEVVPVPGTMRMVTPGDTVPSDAVGEADRTKVDLNLAGELDLLTLSGMTPDRVKRLLQARQEKPNGFEKWQQIQLLLQLSDDDFQQLKAEAVLTSKAPRKRGRVVDV
jgi:DNA uptake protein ComE-like DNA-binding protein